MSESIGPKIELQGEKEYRNALSSINKEMKVLTSEMKATSAEFDGNANSIEALRKKNDILNREYDEQVKKIRTLQGALENSKNVYGENSDKVKDWQIKLNNAEAELSKLDKELKTNDKYLDEAKKSTDGTAKSIDEFGKEVKTAGTETLKTGDIIKANLTSEAIIQGVKALGSAMKDVVKGAVDLTVDAAAYADDIMTMSIQTGIATDKLQAYNYMAELTDTSLEDMTKTMAKNVKSMYSAQTGSKNFKDAYEKLNVEFEDASGNLRDNEDVYWELIDALGEMENKTEADALAMQLFGKSARDLNPLIAVGSKGVAEFTKEAKEMGAILDDETLSSLGDADDAFQRLKQSVDIAKRAVGAEMAPAFEEAAEKITTKVVGMSDEFAEFAGGALNLAVDGLSWVLDNGDKVAGVIGGIGVGMMAFKIGGVISTGMAEAVKAWKAYKIAADGAKISQAGLNAAMATNPITLVATAVGVLAGAMITYSLSTDDAKWGTTEWSRALDKATKSAEELNKQIVESKEARDKNTKKIEAEYGAVQKLSNELFALAEQGDKSAASQEKMKLLVSELNKSMPELSLAFNEQTGELNMQKGEVDKLISSYLEMAKVEAAQESLKEILKEQYEAEMKLQELEEKKPETLGEIMTAYTGIYDFIKNDYGKQIEATKGNIEQLGKEAEVTMKYITENTPAAGQVVDEFGNTVDESAEQISQANQETIESLQKMQEEYEKTLDDTADEIYNSMSLFDEFAKNTEISGETLLKNLQSQVDGMEEWSENLQELSKKGIEEGLLQELYDMGPAAAGEIQALNDMTDEQLQEYNDTWKEKTRLAREVAKDETAGMRKDIEKELDKLPKEAEKTGKKAATSISAGINDNATKAIEAARKAVSNATSAADTEGKKMNGVGKSMVDGLIAGLKSKDGELRSGVAGIAATTLSVMRDKLGIHSPSKVFAEIGEYSAEGFGLGFESKMAKVNEEMSASLPTSVEVLGGNTTSGISEANIAGMVTNIVGNMRLTATVEAPMIIGNEEFGRAVINVQLANDERYNPSPKYA